MDAADVIARLKAMEHEFRAAGLAALYLFGSRARGDHRDDSDVDLAFDSPGREVDLWQRAEIMAAVAERLGIDLDIDLVSRCDLRPGVRQSVDRDLVQVF